MKDGFRQSMAWLHTWTGLLVGWILFAVFLTGTAAYLRPEISHWMRPELAAARPGPQNAEVAMAAMQRLAPRSTSWFITLPDTRESAIRVFWRDPAPRDPAARGRGFRSAVLHPDSGEAVAARETQGGEFFYRFHFELHYLSVFWGRWIIVVCTMFMLMAIISGIITHRRIFADFFTFRPAKGQRSWLDGHNVAAVLALPYHLMITYSGLVIFMAMAMPWGIERAYPNDRQGFNTELFGNAAPRPRASQPVPLAPIAPMLEEAARRWQGGSPGRIAVNNPGDASATVQLTRAGHERISTSAQSLTFDGATGAVIAQSGEAGPAAQLHGVLYGLHLARFAGPALRALFLLAGLAGTVMVATGCVLWAVKQRQQAVKAGRVGFGTRLVEHLNVAAIAGLPLAMAGYFWANRLLPLDLPQRAAWEVHAFFAVWALCLLHPLFRRGRRAWVEQFAVGAVAFALLPLLNFFATDAHLVASAQAGDWLRVGFDLGLLGCGALLGAIAVKVARHAPAAARRPARGPRAAEATP
ncbi:PepSY domain-containing protein [Roseomonas sp. 18066]|uniref:PepSY-associated TM helix domain-containing protein n=1 Tax=Roseomonas sp. 18066 TaxID=2681412 RepID=UPI00190F71EE|nr:PepSY-associated TM helix domain-containing protein [Roseomonas sp. 18066]